MTGKPINHNCIITKKQNKLNIYFAFSKKIFVLDLM